jgi:hypothetical protein
MRAAILSLFLVAGAAHAGPADAKVCDAFRVQMQKYHAQWQAVEAGDDRKGDAVFNLARGFDHEFFARYEGAIFCRGKVDSIDAAADDVEQQELHLAVTVGDEEFHLKFQQGLHSDDGIKRDNPVFPIARALRSGECVLFGGAILERDHPERSATNMGAMREPEYSLRFLSLQRCPGAEGRASTVGEQIRRAIGGTGRR